MAVIIINIGCVIATISALIVVIQSNQLAMDDVDDAGANRGVGPVVADEFARRCQLDEGRTFVAQLSEHPSVKHFYEEKAKQGEAPANQVLDTAWLRQLCMDAGADD